MDKKVVEMIKAMAEYEGANGSGAIMHSLTSLANYFENSDEDVVEVAAMEVHSVYNSYILKLWSFIPQESIDEVAKALEARDNG